MTYDFVNQTQTSSPTEYASAPTLQNSNKINNKSWTEFGTFDHPYNNCC